MTFHDYVLLEKNNQSNSVISQIKAQKLYAALPTTLYQLTFSVFIDLLIYLGSHHSEFSLDFQCSLLVEAIALCV